MPAATFRSLPSLAQASLARVSAAVAGAEPEDVASWAVSVEALPAEVGNLPLLQSVGVWANRSKLCLYYFECASPAVDLAAVAKAFATAKAHEANDRAYARLNARNRCFYVGSSKSIVKRLSEHLGYGAAATYALQLRHWALGLGLELNFVCAKYAATSDYAVVQALEDALWESRSPMFGRQGRK